MTNALPITIPQELIPALLDGRKSQHRVPVDPQPDMVAEPCWAYGEGWAGEKWYCGEEEYPEEGALYWSCPYGTKGQRLFVREVFWDAFKRTEDDNGCVYRADYGRRADLTKEQAEAMAWRSPSRMPQWASRIMLEVTDVRVELVKKINGFDARDEGYPEHMAECNIMHMGGGKKTRRWFREHWNSISNKRGFGWDKNPWVWAITFVKVPL